MHAGLHMDQAVLAKLVQAQPNFIGPNNQNGSSQKAWK